MLDGYWEIIKREERYSLMNYIMKLFSDYQIVNRYIMAEDLDELEEKIDRISTRILYPQYDRIVNNLEQIGKFFSEQKCYDIQIEEEILIKCDKYLCNIKEKLKLTRKQSISGDSIVPIELQLEQE